MGDTGMDDKYRVTLEFYAESDYAAKQLVGKAVNLLVATGETLEREIGWQKVED